MRPSILSRLLAVTALGAGCAFALDLSKLQPSGYVNDFAHVLDAPGRAAIETYCANLEQKTGAQFAVVTIETLDGDSIDDVANKLYHQWGIGKKTTDEGLLLLLAIRDRKQRAEIGYGLEPIISDGSAGDVLRGIRPILRQGNYSGALLAAVQQFGAKVAAFKGVSIETGQPIPPPRRSRSSDGFPWQLIFFGVLLLVFLGMRRGGRGGRFGGGGGGFLPGLILGSILNSGRRGGGGGSDWGGGGFGGGSDSGGFGGFGGGDSGGGGASSDW